MKKLLYLGFATLMLLSLESLTGCNEVLVRRTIHTRTAWFSDWTVTKVKHHRGRPRVRLRRHAVNSKFFNQPGALKF